MCIKMLHLEGTIVLKDFCVFCKLGIVALRNVGLVNFGAEKTDSDRPMSVLHTHTLNEDMHLVMTNDNFPSGIEICEISLENLIPNVFLNVIQIRLFQYLHQ